MAITTQTIEGVCPLDSQAGVSPKKSVPDRLYNVLFGLEVQDQASDYEPASSPPGCKTYAVLDASKATNLKLHLDDSELSFRCLFKDELAEELKHVAPYLVEIKDRNKFTRSLFTDSGDSFELWNKEPGIYIRSEATFDQLWQHFRKFIRVKKEEGGWIYFRFWEPSVLRALPDILEQNNAEKFFLPKTQYIWLCAASGSCGVISRA